jgi:hypothetical protein
MQPKAAARHKWDERVEPKDQPKRERTARRILRRKTRAISCVDAESWADLMAV